MTRPSNPQLISLIQDIVAEEIQTKGIEGVTIRLIAKRAGITPTTVYYYFKSKEELLDKIKFNVARELDDYIFTQLNPNDSAEKKFADLINAFIDWSIDHPKLLDLVFDTLPPKTNLTETDMTGLYQTNFKIIELLKKAAIAQGKTTQNIKADSNIFIGLVYGVVKLFLNKRVLPEYWEDITPLKQRMIEMIFNTLLS